MAKKFVFYRKKKKVGEIIGTEKEAHALAIGGGFKQTIWGTPKGLASYKKKHPDWWGK